MLIEVSEQSFAVWVVSTVVFVLVYRSLIPSLILACALTVVPSLMHAAAKPTPIPIVPPREPPLTPPHQQPQQQQTQQQPRHAPASFYSNETVTDSDDAVTESAASLAPFRQFTTTSPSGHDGSQHASENALYWAFTNSTSSCIDTAWENTFMF